ncbi:MAG: ribonuclease activity regulator RraA [Rhodobacteraceae bacterium]|nr:ribonuclease activity regulator RraA [Paracoccaceae bacterium]PHR53949.1 MAG: ribonuclease activity regulator RraA [Robiginitomaculum sp.]
MYNSPLQIFDQSNIPTINRPDPKLVAELAQAGTAGLIGGLVGAGLRDPFMTGLRSFKPGRKMAGPALTLQFMPKREDLYNVDEYADPEKQLHRHVLYQVQEGDVVCVDACGAMNAGVFGEMMLTYMAGRKGAGVVIDGVIRDSANSLDVDLGFWMRGVSPNFHTQTGIMPFSVNTPIQCAGVVVIPGDIIVADDDGAIVVPIAMAEAVLDTTKHHAEWEAFSHYRLSQGGDLRKYYPLSPDVQAEYEAWKAANS